MAIQGATSQLHSIYDMECNVAFKIYVMYTPDKEATAKEDDPLPSVSYPPFLDVEPIKTSLDLEEKE